jgi:hypothetical protein
LQYTPAIPAFRRLRQDDYKFQASRLHAEPYLNPCPRERQRQRDRERHKEREREKEKIKLLLTERSLENKYVKGGLDEESPKRLVASQIHLFI